MLGRGSSAFVEKRRHAQSGRELALKVIQAGDIAEAQQKAILLELRTFAKCRNTHIVDFYGAFIHENRICIALEYMDAGALSSLLKTHSVVSEKLMVSITWQVLDGLEYLHADMRVIHRDIKPSNLLLNSAGVVKITDFGVSGELEDGLGTQKKVTFVGTMYYMSPERIRGEPHSYNSDMWSLGLVLVECLSGHYPYASDGEARKNLSFWELLQRIDKQEPPRLPADAGLSSEVHDFVRLVLQKERKGRPDAAEMKHHPWPGGPPSAAQRLELAAWVAECCGVPARSADDADACGLRNLALPATPSSSAATRSPVARLSASASQSLASLETVACGSSVCSGAGGSQGASLGLPPLPPLPPVQGIQGSCSETTPLGQTLRRGSRNPFQRPSQAAGQGTLAPAAEAGPALAAG